MNSKIIKWVLDKFRSSNSALLNKISNGLERDKEIPIRFLCWKALIFFYSILTAPFNLRRCDKVGSLTRTRHRPYIENMGKIIIGDEVNINSRNVQTDLVTGPHGYLEIGDKTSINFGVSIVSNEKITIGKRVRIGPYSMIYDSNMHVQGNRYSRAPGNPVTIKDDVWLASQVLVMKGSRIGKGSIIAAGSVVSGIIPPYVVAGGVPARVIKYRPPHGESGYIRDHKENKQTVDNDIIDRVSKVAFNSFAIEGHSVKPEDSHNSIKKWDAFRHVEFIRDLENEFKINLDDKDWSRLTTIKKTSKIVEGYLENSISNSGKH